LQQLAAKYTFIENQESMSEIIRNRTIRPSTRLATSVNYRIHLDGLSPNDTLVVNINHESRPWRKTFRFNGREVLKKKSLGFKVFEEGNRILIHWISTLPING
jgi:hypothetical protein